MTKGKYYIGLDPSLAAFGIAIIDTSTQTIILDQMKSDNHHNFVLMSWAIANMYNEFEETYKRYLEDESTYIAQEAPIASGINSGKLNALGEHYYNSLGKFNNYERIKTYHPIKLKVFHHKKKYTKKDTIDVVTDILSYLESVGYQVKITKSRTKKSLTITDGEADAFMYAILTYINNRPDSQVTKYILEKYPRFTMFESIEETMEK